MMIFPLIRITSIIKKDDAPKTYSSISFEQELPSFSRHWQYQRIWAKTGWLVIRIMCGETCLPADCCFSELATTKTGWLVIRIIWGETCLPADCCFSELATTKIQLSVLVWYKVDIISSKCNLFVQW